VAAILDRDESSLAHILRDDLLAFSKLALLWTRCRASGHTALIRPRGGAMEGIGNVKVLFVAGFGPIVRDTDESRKLYEEELGIRFKEESGSYLHTEALKGAKSFALWPLSQAAQSCFGKDTWPDNIPAPHAWLEFDVDSVEEATAGLESRGYRMLIKNKKEPWGQTVTRFVSPEGLLVGVTFTPAMREKK
jgi:catechol 2,3-dioxygenase-like lactoylglutathione lyase family enzyme